MLEMTYLVDYLVSHFIYIIIQINFKKLYLVTLLLYYTFKLLNDLLNYQIYKKGHKKDS